jgi:hypothetical protein
MARLTQQHDEDLTETPTGLRDDGAQHVATSEAGALFFA